MDYTNSQLRVIYDGSLGVAGPIFTIFLATSAGPRVFSG